MMQAQVECRAFWLSRRSALMRAQLDRLQGKPFSIPTITPRDRRKLEKWRKVRMFVCLVAEDSATGLAVGCVTLNMMQPEVTYALSSCGNVTQC